MSWESIIDQMKDWVLSKGYATEAWVLAKVYATEAWVLAKGYATEAWVTLQITIAYDALLAVIDGLSFSVDRGDPAVSDWNLATLTLDGNWHELDLSGIVTVGTKSVLIRIQLRANAVNKMIMFRKKGHVNPFNRAQTRTTVANVWEMEDLVCAVDTNRKIEYNASAFGLTGLWVTVCKWWM